MKELMIVAQIKTSKKHKDIITDGRYISDDNHIYLWSVAVRDASTGELYKTVTGQKPSELIQCINQLHEAANGDITIYSDELRELYAYMGTYMQQSWGNVVSEINTQKYNPIYKQFANGIRLRDVYILSQRHCKKWCTDLGIYKQWIDYDNVKIKNQKDKIDELEKAALEDETEMLSLCLYLMYQSIGCKKVIDMPYTATGLVRRDIRDAGRKSKGHDIIKKIIPDYHMHLKLCDIAHGAYCNGNPYHRGDVLQAKSYDIDSSYPYLMLAEKYPMGKWLKIEGQKNRHWALKNLSNYAIAATYIGIEMDAKTDMPPISMDRCYNCINPIYEGGKLVYADYVEIEVTDDDIVLIDKYYTTKKHTLTDIYVSEKDYLPKWLRDKIYSYYVSKTKLKGTVDRTSYVIAKTKLNAIYGLCLQDICKPKIVEVDGEYMEQNVQNEETYLYKMNKRDTALLYQWGVWTASKGQRRLYELAECIHGDWYYSDTDSIYGEDIYVAKLYRYNKKAIKALQAAGYEPVNGHTPGTAAYDKKCDEFVYTGAKQYAYRDSSGLHVVISGIDGDSVKWLKDDIRKFRPGFTFKKSKCICYHRHVMPYIDDKGNETAGSIDTYMSDYKIKSEDDEMDTSALTDEYRIPRY